jgi:hypothetical protein
MKEKLNPNVKRHVKMIEQQAFRVRDELARLKDTPGFITYMTELNDLRQIINDVRKCETWEFTIALKAQIGLIDTILNITDSVQDETASTDTVL